MNTNERKNRLIHLVKDLFSQVEKQTETTKAIVKELVAKYL